MTAAPTATALIDAMQAAGIEGDVHLVGGPSTMQAFREIGALAEIRVHVAPIMLGGGRPLGPPGSEPINLALGSTREYPDGVVELAYGVEAPQPPS